MISISLGGGVQSTVLAVMADRGAFGPRPHVGVHADTGWDPPHVLETVEWIERTVSYPVLVVQESDLAEDTANNKNSNGNDFYQIPAYVTNKLGQKLGMSRRQCTSKYKITPIHRALKQFMRDNGHKTCQTWLGISYDEIHRMKKAREPWIEHRWPLVDRKMTRSDCHKWWDVNKPPGAPEIRRSSCVGCPYHSPTEWVAMHNEYPELLAESAEIERSLQARVREIDPEDHTPWLHRRCIPLLEAVQLDVNRINNQRAQAELNLNGQRQAEQRHQDDDDPDYLQADLWGNECEGMCGL